MNIKEATQIVDNPPPINWEWLAGFFQAEGSTGLVDDKGTKRALVSMVSKDHKIVESIETFVNTNLPKHIAHAYSDSRGYGQLRINGTHAKAFLARVCSSLFDKKRLEAYGTLKSTSEGMPQPLCWDFITGFWEGDGSVTQQYMTYHIQFAQKEPDILYAIKDFTHLGSIHQHSSQTNFGYDSGYVLTISDAARHLSMTRELLKHSRTTRRRISLITAIMCEDGNEV